MMPVRKGTIGSGITERETLSSDDPLGHAEIVRDIAERTQGDPIQAIETWARSMLTGLDFPDQGRGEIADACRKITDQFGYDSAEGYAARALDKLAWLRFHIGAGQAELAAMWAYELGLMMREYQMKALHGKNAETGGKVQRGNRDRRDKYNAARAAEADPMHKRLRRERDKILAEHPDMKPGKLARIVNARCGSPYSQDYVRRLLRQ